MIFFIFKKKWIFGCLFCLYGCVSLPKDEQTANLLSPPSIELSIEKSLESGFFKSSDWPESNWWTIFQSDPLNRLISEALMQSPTIQGIEKRVESAKQTAKVARSKLFPLIFFDAEESWELLSHHGLYRAFNPHLPISGYLVDLTLSFTYEFDFWGKNRNLFLAALGENKAQEAESAEVQLIVTTSLAQSYFALKTNLLRENLYEQLLQAREEIFKLQNLLQEKALLSKLHPLLSEENLLEAEKWLLSIKNEIETDRHLINILRGQSPDAPLELDQEISSPLKYLPLPSNLSLDLLARRPDLMAQIWRVEVLAHEVGAAKADFYPDINLTAFLGLESTRYHFLLNSHSKRAALQPAIHLPIFTAGAIRANIRAKKAQFDAAVNDYNNLLLRSAQEVADLLILAQTIYQQKEDQEQIVEAAEQRFELTDLRQQKGLDDMLSWYFAKEEWIFKQLEDVSLLYSQYLATIKLIKALGGGYRSEYDVPLRAQENQK
jgi:NodT family efflux transporter outer membrane factor (OMF) lipoprotein